MRRLVGALALGLICQTALMTTAEARPRHHHRHHHHKAHHRVVQVEPSNFGIPSFPSFFSNTNSVVQKAKSYIGSGAVFGRRNLWCARFMNYVLQKTGHRGTGSDLARSFAKLPRTSMHVGAIAVMSRRGGGHVGVVSGITRNGDPIIVSGNHNNRVAESVYPRSRVYAYVMPN